jgi:peptidoglycan/LPS O-acetylase OafA/YrhL
LSFLLIERTGDRNNNFNLIRFIASTLVIFNHSYILTGTQGEPLYNFGLSFGRVAVDVFFIASGFLVTSSFFARKKFLSFIKARILRIFPGLIVCVLFCVFFIGIIFTSLPINLYIKNEYTFSFLIYNVLLLYKPLQFFLPGVFTNNPYQFAVNGSLWTLPWEIKMYSVLVMIKTLYYIQRDIIDKISKVLIVSIATIATAFYLYYYYVEWGLPHHLLRFASMFFIGSSFWVLKHKILFSYKIILLLMLILLCFISQVKIFVLLYSLFLAYFVIYLAYRPKGVILKFNLLGDYSYGLYIYAFPVQQSIAALIPGIDVPKMFALSFGITLTLSIMSWHLIENRALKLK